MTKTHYCPVEKTTISYEDECNWCGEKENDMKEKALKLAAALNVESSQAEYGYVVDDWKLFSDSADMIRKLVAELDKYRGKNFDDIIIDELNKQGEPAAWLYDNGKWTAETDKEKVWVESSDFTHDVRMYIDGDFEDLPQKFSYANEIAKRLNTAPRELSDEEIKEIADSVCHKWKKNGIGEMYLEDFARAILKKASEK